MAPRGKKASPKKRSGVVSKEEAKSPKKRKVSLAQADNSQNGQPPPPNRRSPEPDNHNGKSRTPEADNRSNGQSTPPQGPERTLPEYNYALGDFLKYGDHLPQKYNDVLTQIYPLQADIGALKDFCDDYLNLTDKWIFEPAAPWVVMQVCNYGKMALLTQSVGWASQHEFAFGFPVAWFERLAHGQRKFRDWAMVYPYIWVDDPLSLTMGRQVYGWAKAGIELKSHRPNLHPDTRCLVSIDRKIGPERYFHDETTRRFLEILQHQPIVSGRTGFATVNSVPPRSMGGYWGALYSMLGTFDSLIAGYEDRLSEYANTGRPLPGLVRESINLGRQSRRWNKYLDVFLSSAQDMTLAQERVLGMPVGRESLEAILDSTRDKVRIITLKQFRDAACPSDACFSAIVGSTLRYGQPIDGGLLRSDPLSPDSSGGILIYLRDDYNIVKELGLRWLAKADDAPKSVHTLRPQMPVWVKVNVSYDAADCQAWRTRYTNWAIDEGWPEGRPETYQISGGDVSSEDSSQETPPKRADTPAIPDKISPVKYNRRGSGASLEVPGPVKSANFGLLVYGLRARKEALDDLCYKYLNYDQPYYQFTPSPPPPDMFEGHKPDPGSLYVLMLVSSFDEMKGATPEFRNLHDRVLTFAIPAKCTPKTPNGKPNESDPSEEDVLIPLYTFVEQDWDFLTESEVYGRLAFKSLLDSPPQTWIEQAKARRELLTVYTSIFPEAPSKPQRERFKPLIQIWDASPAQIKKAHQLQKVREELTVDQIVNTYVQWLGLPPVPPDPHFQTPAGQIDSICLKQVRDAIQTSRACYQEIVSVIRHIDRGWKPGVSRHDLGVRFLKYPGMTISDTMGIVPDDPKDPEAKYQCWVTALPGATISGYMSDEDAQNLCWAIEENGWSDDPVPPPPGP
jgi:hypothetical protein